MRQFLSSKKFEIIVGIVSAAAITAILLHKKFNLPIDTTSPWNREILPLRNFCTHNHHAMRDLAVQQEFQRLLIATAPTLEPHWVAFLQEVIDSGHYQLLGLYCTHIFMLGLTPEQSQRFRNDLAAYRQRQAQDLRGTIHDVD